MVTLATLILGSLPTASLPQETSRSGAPWRVRYASPTVPLRSRNPEPPTRGPGEILTTEQDEYLRLARVAPDGEILLTLWLGPRSGLQIDTSEPLRLRLLVGTLRIRSVEAARAVTLASSAVTCEGEVGDAVISDEYPSGRVQDYVPQTVAVTVGRGEVACRIADGNSERVAAGETPWIEDHVSSLGPKPTPPELWERMVLSLNDPRDTAGRELIGLGSDRERLERIFAFSYRGRPCELVDTSIWSTEGPAQRTLAELHVQCDDDRTYQRRLRKGWQGEWAWMN